MRILCIVSSYLVIALFTLGNTDKFADFDKKSGDTMGFVIVGSLENPNPDKTVVLIKELDGGTIKAVKKGFSILKKYYVIEAATTYLVIEDHGTKYLVR